MIDRFLLVCLAGAALFGALLWLGLDAGETTEKAATVPAPERAEAPSAARLPSPRIDELIATALSRPLFSATRRPPERAKGDQQADPGIANLRLTGIVIEPGRHLAIFAVPGAKPLVRSEGDTVNEWRIESIAPREVSLSGPAGTTRLEPKTDPALVGSARVPRPGANPAQPAAAGSRAATRAMVAPKPPAAVAPARAPSVVPGSPRPPNLPGRQQ